MKKSLTIAIIGCALLAILLSGCAMREYTSPDGAKLRSVTFFQSSKVEGVTVSKTGLKISGAASRVDAEAIEAAAEGAARGATK